MKELIESLWAGYSVFGSINRTVELLGAAALAIILIIGLAFFLPTIFASARKIQHRTLICIVNVLSIVTMFMKFYIPVILWLLIMIIAVCDKREKSKTNAIPTINIIKYNEENK